MRKHYTAAFKSQMVQEILKEEKTIAQISSEYGVHSTQLKKWKALALEMMPSLFSDEQKALEKAKAEFDQKEKELYAEIGKLTTQLAWCKKKSGIQPE